jgi:acetoacetyl-CoA reductase
MARIALVTGGTRGIGEAISLGLREAGRTVIASYAGNEKAAQAFHANHGIPVIKFDAGDFAACEAAVAQIREQHGPIEILVNNAGITRDGTMGRMTREMWDSVLDTNLGSCFNLCKLTFEHMRAQKFGRIVNIGSINGQAGQYGQVNYAAAKSGIHGFTKALAQE